MHDIIQQLEAKRAKARLPQLMTQVEQGDLPASTAARQLLALWHAQP